LNITEAKKTFGERCVICGEEYSEMHHAYGRQHNKRLGNANEILGLTLFPLCARCHKRAHKTEMRNAVAMQSSVRGNTMIHNAAIRQIEYAKDRVR